MRPANLLMRLARRGMTDHASLWRVVNEAQFGEISIGDRFKSKQGGPGIWEIKDEAVNADGKTEYYLWNETLGWPQIGTACWIRQHLARADVSAGIS